jgi:hypothetical protein
MNGATRTSARLANDLETIRGFFVGLGEPCRPVLKHAGTRRDVRLAGHDREHIRVELAHPYPVRAIAAAQVKSDAIDAHTLATKPVFCWLNFSSADNAGINFQLKEIG